jgi:hypothetical protein
MTCTADALSQMSPAIESQLKPWLVLAGGYLPQTWVFQTEEDAASITVEKSGKVRTAAGAAPHPDVTIVTDHTRLSIALKTRDRSKVPPGPPPKVTFHTTKGETAWNFLKGRFGL